LLDCGCYKNEHSKMNIDLINSDMITNQRDSTVHDNIFINDRVNCGHDRFTFKSRCAVRSYHFNTRVPPTTTFKKLRKKLTLSEKRKDLLSPLQLLK
jgi:hypothetical protein